MKGCLARTVIVGETLTLAWQIFMVHPICLSAQHTFNQFALLRMH